MDDEHIKERIRLERKQHLLHTKANLLEVAPECSEKLNATIERFTSYFNPIKNAILNAIISPNVWKAFQAAAKLETEINNYHYNQFMFKKATSTLWDAFANEIQIQNRFFPKTEFINIFEQHAKKAKYMLRKGSILYRARKIEEAELSDKVKDLLSLAIENYNTYSLSSTLYNGNDIWEYIEGICADTWERDYTSRFSLQNNAFWGFSAQDSDAPPPQYANHGRANPKGISYLYTARDQRTAISEVQPTIGQLVSVGKIKTKKSLKLFSFDFSDAYKHSGLMDIPLVKFKEHMGMSFWELQIFFDVISDRYSRPALGNEESYYATQYLSEFIKNMGFDGIKFKSSLCRRGSNIVLFDTAKDVDGIPYNYEILETSVNRVNRVSVFARKILPLMSKNS